MDNCNNIKIELKSNIITVPTISKQASFRLNSLIRQQSSRSPLKNSKSLNKEKRKFDSFSIGQIKSNFKNIDKEELCLKKERFDYYGNEIKKKGKQKIIFADCISDKILLEVSFINPENVEKIPKLIQSINTKPSIIINKAIIIDNKKEYKNCEDDKCTCLCIIY